MTDHPDWSARRRAWKVERFDPAVARAPERSASFSTLGEIELEPLYGPWSWDEPGAGPGGPTAVDHHGDPLPAGRWDDFDPSLDVGLPGESPFTRGIHPSGYRSRLWTMRMFAGFGAAGELIVIDVETRSRGRPPSRTSMSARDETATPHVPNSPSASGWSVS